MWTGLTTTQTNEIMPAKMATKCAAIAGIFFIVLLDLVNSMQLSTMKYVDVVEATYRSCVVCIPEALIEEKALQALSYVVELSFEKEHEVVFHRVDFSLLNAKNDIPMDKGPVLHVDMFHINYTNSFITFTHLKKDRTCLLAPPVSASLNPKVFSFQREADYVVDTIVGFVNHHCQTFRKTNGNLTPQGIHKEHILNNLFSVASASTAEDEGEERHFDRNESDQSITVCKSQRNSDNKGKNDCSTQNDVINENIATSVSSEKYTMLNAEQKMQQCERISLPTNSEFLDKYLTTSKPVVITGATSQWPVFRKWTKQYLLDQYGDIKVHIKITPNGEYEGVEPSNIWENKSKIKIPRDVLEKLPFPDIVVVRPATMEIQFSEFLDLIESISSSKSSNISAYLEYSSISFFPNLQNDIAEMSFIEGILDLKHTNIWLSDGNTVGKLHFDPFDNFMCQISGEKEFIIYAPHANERLYEAHIQEAMLSYNTSTKSFSRQKLLESTSMVMSPVDIEKPNLQRFPKFAEAKPMSCTIKPGDVLFTPAFWWHEVRSKPNATEHRNLAVNFWYDPFFLKEFPCPECRLYVNPKYFNLL